MPTSRRKKSTVTHKTASTHLKGLDKTSVSQDQSPSGDDTKKHPVKSSAPHLHAVAKRTTKKSVKKQSKDKKPDVEKHEDPTVETADHENEVSPMESENPALQETASTPALEQPEPVNPTEAEHDISSAEDVEPTASMEQESTAEDVEPTASMEQEGEAEDAGPTASSDEQIRSISHGISDLEQATADVAQTISDEQQRSALLTSDETEIEGHEAEPEEHETEIEGHEAEPEAHEAEPEGQETASITPTSEQPEPVDTAEVEHDEQAADITTTGTAEPESQEARESELEGQDILSTNQALIETHLLWIGRICAAIAIIAGSAAIISITNEGASIPLTSIIITFAALLGCVFCITNRADESTEEESGHTQYHSEMDDSSLSNEEGNSPAFTDEYPNEEKTNQDTDKSDHSKEG